MPPVLLPAFGKSSERIFRGAWGRHPTEVDSRGLPAPVETGVGVADVVRSGAGVLRWLTRLEFIVRRPKAVMH